MALSIALTSASSALAYDVNDKLSVRGSLGGAFQCQEVSGLPDSDNTCRGAAPFHPELSYNPTAQDQFFIQFGFATGNGLDQGSAFVLAPWAADMHNDVKNINGRNRSNLLEARYAHSFQFAEDNTVQITGGIIDSTVYVDTNAYANNWFTQFMNAAFVNARNAFLPSYDWGGALVWAFKGWTFSAVGMNVGENDDGNSYNYYAAQAAYHLTMPLGGGSYRVMYSGTSRAFLDPMGVNLETKGAWVLSFDQELGSVVGAFLRMGWQSDEAQINFKAAYTGGFDFKGAAWGRDADDIGIAFGYLGAPSWSPLVQAETVAPADPGVVGGTVEAPTVANQVLARTNVFETYYSFALNDHLAVSADVQYMEDKYREGDDVDGWIFGLRAVAQF